MSEDHEGLIYCPGCHAWKQPTEFAHDPTRFTRRSEHCLDCRAGKPPPEPEPAPEPVLPPGWAWRSKEEGPIHGFPVMPKEGGRLPRAARRARALTQKQQRQQEKQALKRKKKLEKAEQKRKAKQAARAEEERKRQRAIFIQELLDELKRKTNQEEDSE